MAFFINLYHSFCRLVSGAGEIKLTKDGNVLLHEMVRKCMINIVLGKCAFRTSRCGWRLKLKCFQGLIQGGHGGANAPPRIPVAPPSM